MESQLAHVKGENTKLRKEKDALLAQKESLEQLLVTMASETVESFSMPFKALLPAESTVFVSTDPLCRVF